MHLASETELFPSISSVVGSFKVFRIKLSIFRQLNFLICKFKVEYSNRAVSHPNITVTFERSIQQGVKHNHREILPRNPPDPMYAFIYGHHRFN